MKKKSLSVVCTFIGVVGFFLMLGSVGTMDLNLDDEWTIPLALLGAIMMVVSLVVYTSKSSPTVVDKTWQKVREALMLKRRRGIKESIKGANARLNVKKKLKRA